LTTRKEHYKNKLCIAAQGALAKTLGSEEFRIIHDGTNQVDINRAIRVRDQLRNPTHHEGTRYLQEMAQDPSHFHFSLMVDVRKAHRRVAVREGDWPFQACKVRESDDHLFLNCVGTFGIASAGYWWGRLYAAVTRALHYGLGTRYMLWALSYADDSWLVGRGQDAFRSLAMALLLLTVLDIPFTWGKVRGGFQTDWIGYWVDVARFQIGISFRRQEWLVKWITGKLAQPAVLAREMREGLGRLGFAAGPLEHLRPFLGPVYAWCAVTHPAAYAALPLLLRIVLELLLKATLAKRVVLCREPRRQRGELFRLDAKAEGDDVMVGGWETGPSPSTSTSRWFAVRLTRRNAPWAFARGETFRVIAALELFGFLCGVMAFVEPNDDANFEGEMCFTAFTDNQSNGFLIDRLQTTKFPLCLILMEVAWQLQERNISANLRWVPRLQNEEADALTNGDFSAFDPERRIHMEVEKMPFGILPRLLEVEVAFTSGLAEAKAKAKASLEAAVPLHKTKRLVGDSLRLRDPW